MFISAGIIIFRNFGVSTEPELLLLQSTECKKWGPPKGHLENDEDGIQAALRETYEEAGITLAQLHIIEGFEEVLRYTSTNKKQKNVVYYLGKLKDPNSPIKLSDEHVDFAWTTVKDAAKFTDSESFKTMFFSALSFLQNRK